MTLLKELIDIPERLGGGDFVFTLENAVDRPDEVLENYVVTPQLQEAFDDALDQIASALDRNESRATYLHGSFGSGKSHFMAVLYLLLANVAAARAVPELQGCVAEHDSWLGEKKFLLVPVHMINANVERLEEAVLAAYVDRVTDIDPDAPAPAVYRSGPILENAATLRDSVGDEQFFSKLNEGGGGDSGLGKLEAPRWDGASYGEASTGKPGDEAHDALIAALVANWLPAFAEAAQGEQYISLDDGLSVISKHAQSLGYDGLILFLDELILWLATRMADLNWVKREGQKMATLRESPKSERPIPIASFIARQRDLRDLLGDHYAGEDKTTFHDALSYSEGRFHVITLEDRNLRAIAEKRVLAPKNEEARKQIDAAFEKTMASGEHVISTLLGDTGSPEEFRAVYPFSPAFIDILVAASSALQRERTAIRVMVQLLSERRDEIELGDVIPVGDLFDVLKGADEPFSQEMKQQFREAQDLYDDRLLPQVEANAKVPAGTALPPAASAEDRLVKTLLLAALIFDAGPLRGLTVSRLVALNHGTIATPIPGQEATTALAGLRRLRGSFGQLKIQEGSVDPAVQIELAGIDTDAIVSGANEFANWAARRRYVKTFLWDQLDLGSSEELFTRFRLEWHGIDRELDIALENVRELSPERATALGDEWKVIVDYPFDVDGSTRADDQARIEVLKNGIDSSKTVFWLPAFVTSEVMSDLTKLVTIEALLTGERLRSHTPHLSPTDQLKARQILESQRDQLRATVGEAFEQAYGISNPKPELIEGAEKPLFDTLDQSLQVRQPVGTDLRSAMIALADQLLGHQYPASPAIGDRVTPAKVSNVWALIRDASEQEGGRLDNPESSDRKLLKAIAEPLELGQVHEGPFVLGTEWRDRFTRAAGASKIDEPSVGQVRGWINDPEARGLTTALEQLIALAYAAQGNFSFELHGAQVAIKGPADLNDEMKLVEVALPSQDEWDVASTRASVIFGIAVPALRSAQNLARYGSQVQARAQELQQQVKGLNTRIEETLDPDLGIEGDTDRVRVGREAASLVEQLSTAGEHDALPLLARFELTETPESIARTLAQAGPVSNALATMNWNLVTGARKRADNGDENAKAALQPLIDAAQAAEIVLPLADALRTANDEITRVIVDTPKPPLTGDSHRDKTVAEAREILDRIDDPERVRVDLTIRHPGSNES